MIGEVTSVDEQGGQKKTKKIERPPVPLPLKRLLRQEAGFGCCVCGFPFFDYQHIIPYSEDPYFRPEDMMTLCPNHHSAATNNALSIEEQRRFKKNPFNIKNGFSEGLLSIQQPVPAISTGSFNMVGNGPLIIVDGECLLGINIAETRLELSIELYDSDDKHLVSVNDNEWISFLPSTWDIEARHRWITIRSKPRNISLEVDARKYPIRIRADFWRNGILLELGKNGFRYNNENLQLAINNYTLVAHHISINSSKSAVSIQARPGGGMIPDLDANGDPLGLSRALKLYDSLRRS